MDSKKFPSWIVFAGNTLLYTVILIGLLYLYHYKDIQGGSFIYNEF